MTVYELDPLGDPRWTALVESHPLSSIFHTREWLNASRQTYIYKLRAFTTSAPGKVLSNGIVFCQVNSWLTGSRLVSLPFSDHCDPLVESTGDLEVLLSAVTEKAGGSYAHAEIRPAPGFELAEPDLEDVYFSAIAGRLQPAPALAA